MERIFQFSGSGYFVIRAGVDVPGFCGMHPIGLLLIPRHHPGLYSRRVLAS